MDVKMRLAQEIIGQFHGKEAAKQAEQNFQRVFRNREAPEEIPEIRLKRAAGGVHATLPKSGVVAEEMTLPLKDPTYKLNLEKPGSYRVRFGKKKFLRIVVE